MTSRPGLSVRNLQRAARANRPALLRLLTWTLSEMQTHAPRRRFAACSLALVDDERIAAVNQAFLGHDGPTDVISFAYAPTPGAPPGLTGELLVNVQQAVREARARKVEPSAELALYIVHGGLHLAGETDDTPARRRRMRRLERAWLKRAGAARVLRGLLRRISGEPQRAHNAQKRSAD
jgi:probable rRNA maturation factor